MRSFITVFLVAMAFCGAQARILITYPCLHSTIALLDSAGAAPLLATGDSYTRSFTPFDLISKVGAGYEASEKGYLRKAAEQARTWSLVEEKIMRREIAMLNSVMVHKKLNPVMPDTIWLIKTTAKEEYGAEGFTRRNMIMLKGSQLSYRLLAHELFHVISRHDTARRDAAYAQIGFRKCNPINVSAAMAGRSISNPDCPVIEHFITLKDSSGLAKDFVLLIYSERDYTGGDIFSKYLTPGFLEISGPAYGKKPVMKDGKPVVHGLYTLPDLFDKVGRNTSYLIHCEEISAEHFAMLITGEQVVEPKIIQNLQRLFQ